MELPPGVYRRAHLLADGYSEIEVRRLLRTGELSPLRPGSYLRGDPPQDPSLRHALAARAVLPRLGEGAVFSHVTAAVLHGLPTWGFPLDRVHATRPRRCGGRRSRAVLLHSAALSADEITSAAGLPVTGVARTVVELARTVPFEAAVVVADAALRGERGREPLDPEELSAALDRSGRWPGAPAARRVIAFADGRSESVGESRSRVALLRAGVPAPVPQWEVIGPDGRWIGRVDFGWPAQRTVGEFDGKIKYARLLTPGRDPGDVVFAEKRREDRLRDAGLAVVRWTWSELPHFAPVADRIRARFAERRSSPE